MASTKEYTRAYAKAHWQRVKNDPVDRKRRMDAKLRLNHGITFDAYLTLLVKQEGCCAICKTTKPSPTYRAEQNFHVDHDHKTGKIRGLLCLKCNRGIGIFDDDPAKVEQAAAYLRRTNESV
jgi:hypothetical protein